MSEKGPSKEDLLAQLDLIESEEYKPPPKSSLKSTRPAHPRSSTDKPASNPPTEADDFPDFPDLAKPLRPITPQLARTRSPKVATPPSTAAPSARTSEERGAVGRKSAESGRSLRAVGTPGSEGEPGTEGEKVVTEGEQGGGWWGGLFATATAAVKTAEAAVREVQRSEDAQRWVGQVRGNVGVLRGLGGELTSRALPTFTNILHTLAPPISQHERLQIHITHDLVGYPALDPMIYQVFSRVMSQVEGGDLLVIQRGSESAHRRSSSAGVPASGPSGWNDGPWWRQADVKRDIGAVKGLVEGTKLVVAGAEAFAHEFFAQRGGVEEAAKQATEVLSASNPVRSSDIFLAIQAVSYAQPGDLFTRSASEEGQETGGVEEPKESEELVVFAIYLHDPIHSISFRSLSQAVPLKWIEWLDAAAPEDGTPPEEIWEIMESGGLDPREWVAEWVEEVISLAVGVVAQRYVARRMGVGEGGLGRGKARQAAVESGAGELARAL
ncbi:hypothetical protein P152DRAFT_504830 [Eremomyces bilateralis CBS 781.70]|uniref:Maintenance of telomere capping protein 1 n=1 Tax=Eremomyces bilateralis CBS 781.70 TaxID=1392243 RepID=A0A6G1GD37_9PEZI|nr:uncharacterized protein P152DRAFT_504830 [Eremomyces bilateralis CBS 781.70]KAF1816015.1 hypothetical protein P152DRAFT_504830 [Eremomyces bilateralis CBS 781.70]